MLDRIYANRPRSGVEDLAAVLASNLSYKIAVTHAKFVESFSDTFELGDCEYGFAVDSLLQHTLVGSAGPSEVTTTSRNANFLAIFECCCGFVVYRDQVDPSSTVRKHPDDTLVYNGCVCLKNEAKADARDAAVARKELIDKLSRDALRVFPANSQSIFGMTTFPNLINIYSIGFNASSNSFFTTLLSTFNMGHLQNRVRFVKAVFKIAEWIFSVPGPHEEFHLVPSVRMMTPNGHHITWTKGYLLKELKLHKTGRTRVAAEEAANMRLTMDRISDIYAAHLDNVSWGTVELPNLLKVTRIGFMLERAILANMITKEKALADVRKGESALSNGMGTFFCLMLTSC